jgi:hypothetical protein
MDSKEEQLDKWALDRIAYLFKKHDNLNQKFKYTPQMLSIGRHIKPEEIKEISNDLTNSLNAINLSTEQTAKEKE